MGATGKYKIEYQVNVQQLRTQLNQVQGLVSQHARVLSSSTTGTLGSSTTGQSTTQAKLDIAAMNAQARYMNAQTAQAKQAMRAQNALNQSQKQGAGSAMTLGKQIDNLQLALSRMVLWWGSAALIMGGKELISTIQEVAGNYQYAVRELTVMGDEGEATYKRLAMSSFDWAADTARSFEEANQAMQEWLRQGYSSVEIAELTRNTLIGLNLAQMSTSGLVKTLTAEMRAYNIPASESISIIDKLVGVERKYAVSSEELAVGLRRFASVANEANVTMDQQIALMTAMIVRTQQAPESVGTAARTMLIRLTGVGTKVIETIGKVNVYADEQNRTFRSSWDILSDLASKWNTYDDVQKKQIATAVAGVRQQEFFIALMKDFDLAIESNIVSLGSAGLAYRANMQLMDTYKGVVGALKAEWDKLLSSQSGILDMFTLIAKGARQLIIILQGIPKEIAYLAPAIVMGLGAAIYTINPLLGIVTIVAGAFAGLSAIIGATTVNIGDMLRKAKDLAEAQYLEAKSTSELAKQYIKLYDEQRKGADNNKLLVTTRDQLNKLMPTLLSGEQDLSKIYNILNGQVGELDANTKRLFESRRNMLKSELYQQQFEAQQALITGEIPKELLDRYGGEERRYGRPLDKYDVPRLEELRSKLEAEIPKIITPVSRTDIEAQRKILEEERTAIMQQSGVWVNVPTEEDALKRINTIRGLSIDKIFQHVKAINELIMANNKYKYTVDALRNVDKEPTSDVTDGGDGEAPIPERDLETRLLAAQRQAILAFYGKEGKIETDRNAKLEQEKRLRQDIFDVTKSFLVAEGSDEEAQKKLREYQEGGTALLEKKIEDLKTQLEKEGLITEAILNRQEREKRNLHELINLQAQYVAEGIERVQGPVAALQYRFQRAAQMFYKSQAEYEAIPDDQEEAKVEAEKVRDEAKKNALNLFIQWEKARGDQAERVGQTQQRINKLSIQLEQARLGIEVSEVEKAKNIVDEYQEQYDLAKNVEDREKARENLIKSQLQYEEEVGKAKQKDKEIQKEINDAVNEYGIDTIKAKYGEYAAAVKLVEIRQQEYDALRDGNDKEKAKEELQKAVNSLHLIYLNQLKEEAEAYKQIQLTKIESEGKRRYGLMARFRGEESALVSERQDALYNLLKAREELRGAGGPIKAPIDIKDNFIRARATFLNADESLKQFRYDEIVKKMEIVDESYAQKRQALLDYEEEKYGEIAMLKLKLNLLEEDRQNAQEGSIAQLIAINQKEATRIQLKSKERELDRQRYIALIQYASALGTDIIGATVGGNKFNWGSAISGGAGLVSSLMFAANPVLGAGIAAGGAVIGALVDNMTSQDKNTEVINMNTVAIDRNTQTLNDVFAKAINIPTSFMMPAVLTHYGMVPSAHTGGYVERGGLVNVKAGESIGNVGSLTININGANQSSDQIANKVMYAIERKWSIQSRSGGVTPLLAS